MAETRISDIVVPEVFTDYMLKQTKEKSLLFQSEIVVDDPQIDELAKGGGTTFKLPFWNDLDGTESNVGSDNPASSTVPNKLTAGQDVAVKHFRNQSWSSTDLASAVAGDDPMRRVADRVASYWARDLQRTLIASLTGVFADNLANAGGDMVHDIATDAAGAPADAELVSAEAILDAKQTMGDAAEDLIAIAMHSVVYTRLQKLNLIDFIPDARGEVRFPQYLGYRVIVDDGCPALSGTNRITYTSYLFGRGAAAHGEGSPRTPVEVDREPAKADGEGIEVLHSRRHFILHPRGIAFQGASVAGKSPSNAELEDAANWSRVYERKDVRLVALRTNG